MKRAARGKEPGRLSPVNFRKQAQEFLEAAEREFGQSTAAISFPAYFLAARALELALKSFLLAHGVTAKRLRKISHDLEKGLAAAKEKGLGEIVQIREEDEAVAAWLNVYYVTKDMEYVTTGYKSYPDAGAVLVTVRRLLHGIGPVVRAWRPSN